MNASNRTEFEALIGSNYAALRRFVSRKISNQASAEDVLQDALCDAYRSLDSYRGDAHLLGWVFGIVSNKVYGHYRREAATNRLTVSDEGLLDSVASDTVGPSDNLEGAQKIRRLAALMAALPSELRLALWDVAVEGAPYEDVARVRGIPVGTLRSRLSRARSKIREALEPAGQ